MEIISGSAQETLDIGQLISGQLERGDIICLLGDLGSGKTVLTKGISLGLGVDKDKVTSPTFVILRQHEGKFPIYHFDLYRLSSPEDILDLGYEEYFFDEGISVIEWADKLGKLLPKEFLKIQMAVTGEKQRKIMLSAKGLRYKKLLEDIREDFMR
jgi:tRNA threonylcarbamoyladenosine biosynthesis protein TsaE